LAGNVQVWPGHAGVLLNERAGALYRGVGQQGLVGFDVSDATEVISRSKYNDLAAEHDIMLVDELRGAERALRDQQAQAEQAQVDLKVTTTPPASARRPRSTTS